MNNDEQLTNEPLKNNDYKLNYEETMKKELMQEELKLLRDELKNLKECQTKYVALAVASVGAIFSYLFGNSENLIQYDTINFTIYSTYLIPLVVVLPMSCIFFNKAVTITRIVGYYQVLEDFNLGNNKNMYIGWENSLKEYRKYGREREKFVKQYCGKIKLWENLSLLDKSIYLVRIFGFNLEPLHKDISKNDNISAEKSYNHNCPLDEYIDNGNSTDESLSDISKPQTYWELVYGTFFAMCMLCFILSIGPAITLSVKYLMTHGLPQKILVLDIIQENKFNLLIVWIFLSVSLYILRFNLKTLYQLERGFHNYYANHVFWDMILIKSISREKIDEKMCMKNNEKSDEKSNEKNGWNLTWGKIPKPQKRMIIFFVVYVLVILIILFYPEISFVLSGL